MCDKCNVSESGESCFPCQNEPEYNYCDNAECDHCGGIGGIGDRVCSECEGSGEKNKRQWRQAMSDGIPGGNINLDAFDNLALNLEILAEEASEIGQIKSKIIRFGLDDYHPKNGAVNRAKLEEEIGHFMAMVDILIAQKTITAEGVESGKQQKFKKLPRWYR